ncbi:hypothetical protein vseg_008233 [Gypsophila vaccaria]
MEEVGPTEETVLALLEFLVDPLLPSKCSSNESPSQEQLVAKQVHAVVLLYNYYHRKHDPGLEFLEFISFCKLSTGLRSSLLPYFPIMQKSDYGNLEIDDMVKHMSLTEKAVMDACDISRSLDASIAKPVIESWPISKVAVFLVDSKKENCFLFHSAVTQGVWSVIEKEVSLPSEENANKKKRVIKKTSKENQTVDEASLHQIAYSAVKDACGLNRGHLKILETHLVYSTSKAKTAVRLYIMRCTQSKQDENLIPITDALGSLQGPLVWKESKSWLVTSVVEYFHLLPLVDEVSEWLPRSKEIDETETEHVEAADGERCHSPNLKVEDSPYPSHKYEEVNVDYKSSHSKEKLVVDTPGILRVAKETAISDNHQSKEENIWRQEKESPMVYKKRNRSQKNGSSNCQGTKKINATKEISRQEKESPVNGLSSTTDAHEPFKTCPSGTRSNFSCEDRTDDQKQIIVAPETDQFAFNEGDIVVAEDLDTNSHVDNANIVYSDQYEKQDCAIVSFDSNLENLQKIQQIIASKDNLISQTALKVLYRKRELLSQQLRVLGDELALCDRNIDIILKGGEDDLDVKLNSVLEGCNDICLRSSATENKTGLHLEDPDLPPLTKRKRLSEASLSSHDPCRELDSICIDNNWNLPTYDVSTLEGGFKASVTVKVVDFECEGSISTTPRDARNSAALQILAKLQNMQYQCSSQREISPENAMLT